MFSVNDTATISRGRYRGKQATILAPAEAGQYPVRIAEGEDAIVAVINADNLKAPAEGSVTESRLAAELQTTINDFSTDPGGEDAAARAAVRAIMHRLADVLPGLEGRLGFPDYSQRI